VLDSGLLHGCTSLPVLSHLHVTLPVLSPEASMPTAICAVMAVYSMDQWCVCVCVLRMVGVGVCVCGVEIKPRVTPRGALSCCCMQHSCRSKLPCQAQHLEHVKYRKRVGGSIWQVMRHVGHQA
jgi:hypothetical protein